MKPQSPAIAAIALGANLGDRRGNLRAALDQLGATPGVRVLKVSSFLDNPAEGGPADSPPYLNAAALLETTLCPRALLRRMLEIEKQMGRVRRVRWEPRPIDLDLLLYGDQVVSSPELMLPHPLMHDRVFVLQPLAEIAPDLVHPTLQASIAGLLEALRRREP